MIKKIFFVAFTLLSLSAVITLSCRKDLRQYENNPPVAKAGDDAVIVLPLDSVKLDGRASNDPDGSIKEFLWSKISGPAIYAINSESSSTTTVKNLVIGTYHFQLTVTDNSGISAKDTLQVIVNPAISPNYPPIADAGPDQTITLAEEFVLLDGSQSTDPEGNIVSYKWTKIDGPSSFTIVDEKAVHTQAKNLTEGVYLFELKVTDAGWLESKDTVRINVLPIGTTEIILTELTWINQCYDPRPGVCWINSDAPSYGFYINNTSNLLPDSSKTILGVWIKMDTSSVWERVPGNCWEFPDTYPQTNFTYCFNSESFRIYSWFFSPESLEGRKAEVKIRF